MPLINEEKLAKMLKEGIRDNIWLLFGNDTFLKDLYCEKLTDAVVSGSLKAFNLRVFNDDSADMEEILEACDILPVMSDRTCVLVRNYPLASLNKESTAAFEAGLKNLPETTVLIFFFNTINIDYGKKDERKWTDIVNLVMKYGVCARIDKRTPERTAKMLVSRAKQRNTEISQEDARYLTEAVGGDMQVVQSEFYKLCDYADGRPITRAMIDEICSKTVEASSYDISKCILSGDTDRAYKIITELLHQKTKKEYLLGSIASAFVNSYRYKLALNANKSVSEFKEAFGIKTQLGELGQFVRKTKLSDIKKCIDILLEADVKIKSTSADEYALFTELTAKLAATVEE